MPDNRCFRIDDLDVEELRAHTRDQQLIDAFSNWAERFAPRVDGLISEISAAFADTHLDSGVGLFQATGLDDYASDEELERLRERDEKSDWSRISYADLQRCYAAPSFFDAKGFVFHLPAFLIAELNDRHPYDFISRLFQAEEHPSGWRQLLSDKQRRALISMLNLIKEHPNYEHGRSQIELAIQRLDSAANAG